ncbi:Hypothetical predicted protein, partial [Marmota monax]
YVTNTATFLQTDTPPAHSTTVFIFVASWLSCDAQDMVLSLTCRTARPRKEEEEDEGKGRGERIERKKKGK